MVNFEEVMLQEGVEKNEQCIDIEDKNTIEEDKCGDVGDDIKISETLFCRLKRAWVD